MPRSSAVEPVSTPLSSARSNAVKIAIGSVAIVVWGLIVDELARVGYWVLDTAYSPLLGQYHDLRLRYDGAGKLLHHHSLYSFGPNPDSNPPFAALAFLPFHVIGWRATETVWTVVSLCALAVVLTIELVRWFGVPASSAWLASGAGLAAAGVAVLYPVRSELVWGQLGLVLLALVMVDLFVVPRQYRGVLIGVAVAIKLFPALFIVWFLARRDVAATIRLVVSFLVCTLIAALVWWHESTQYWLHILPSYKLLQLTFLPLQRGITRASWISGVGHLGNQSLRGLLGRPPFLWFGTFPWLPIAILVLAVGIYATVGLLRQQRDLAAVVTLFVTTMLVAPVSWLHYWVFVALAPFVAVLEWRRDRALSIAAILLTLATCADLEDAQLFSGPVTSVAPVLLFVVRNLYVLGALCFLVVAVLRSRGPASATERASADSEPTVVTAR
jgi:alpha-1,2-mannosyltransferase